MAIKFPWLAGAIRYENGFRAFVWRDVKQKKAYYYKVLALLLVVTGTLSGLVAEFEAIEGYRDGYGIKAATCALGAAAIVFISMISTTGVAKPWFDLMIRGTGGVFAFLAGIFWVLAETGGNIQPYVLAVAFNGAALFTAVFVSFLIGSVNRLEATYQRRRKEAEQPTEEGNQ